MAERPSRSQLPVKFNHEYRVVLGKSFTAPEENACHTFSYDFKPKSVDSSQPSRLTVYGDEVHVSLPNINAETEADVTHYKGGKRTCTKECVLIINKETGAAMLERIINSVHFKRVRDTSQKKRSHQASPTPSKPLSKPPPTSYKPLSATHSPLSNRTTVKSVKKKPTKETKSKKLSSKATPTGKVSKATKPKKLGKKTKGATKTVSPLLTLPRPISPLSSNNPTPEPLLQATYPESQMILDASSSSSWSSSSSDSDNEMDLLPSMPSFTSQPPQSAINTTFTHSTVDPGFSHMTVGSGHMTSGSGHMTSLSNEGNLSDSSNDEMEAQSSLLVSSGRPTNVTSSDLRPRSMSLLQKDLQLSDSSSSD